MYDVKKKYEACRPFSFAWYLRLTGNLGSKIVIRFTANGNINALSVFELCEWLPAASDYVRPTKTIVAARLNRDAGRSYFKQAIALSHNIPRQLNYLNSCDQ